MGEDDRSTLDVLVVGAGPGGLTAALALAQGDVEATVVDAGQAPGHATRAVWVQPRTLELWRGLGVADEVTAGGVAVDALRVHGIGTSPKDLSLRTDSPFVPHLVPQPHTERCLIDALTNSGIRVQWGTRLVDIDVAREGPHLARLEHADGSQTTVRAHHVIGADGARSVVRRSTGGRLDGTTRQQTLFVANVTGDLSLGTDVAHLLLMRQGALAMLPLPGRRWRVAGTTDQAGRVPALDEMLKLFGTVTVGEVRTHVAHSRHVVGDRPDGVTLVGDAAHLHSSVGGQGLNLAAADAHAVAWRLVARHRGATVDVAAAAHERRAVAGTVGSTTDLLFRVQTTRGPIAALARRLLFWVLTSPALAASPLGAVPARVLAQVDHVPEGGPLSTAVAHVRRASAQAGARVTPVLPMRDVTRHALVGVTPDAANPAPSKEEVVELLGRDPVLLRQVEVHGGVVSPDVCGSLAVTEPSVALLRPDDVIVEVGHSPRPASVRMALADLSGSATSVSSRPH